MKVNFYTILFLFSFSFLNAQTHPIVSGHELEYRIVRISTNFLVDSNLEPTLDIITTASENCYNGVMLSDVKFGYLDAFANSPNYFANLHTFLDSAKVLGLQVFPETVSFGYSGPILFHNPNLAEGLPVIDAPFIVENTANGLAIMNAPDDVFDLQNADFENLPSSSNVFPGWSWQDGPGSVTFWDTNVSHSGNASARVTNPGQGSNGNARIVQNVSVTPFRDYHVSVWVKTENFDPALVNILVLNSDNNRSLNHNEVFPATTQDWTKVDLTFNTLDSENISIYFGVWGGGNGNLWWDDIVIEPSRFNNVIRREGTPVTITDETGNVLVENVDVNPIVDPLSGNDPWSGAFSIWHDQPMIYLPAGSPLQAGDQLNISYYHAAIVNNGQVTASLTAPEVFDITQSQLTSIRNEFIDADIFDGWFLGYDEIRAHNWDESPNYGSPGENLAFNFSTVKDQAEAIDDDAIIMTWNDMFDPHHNAYESGNHYYLVNELWGGSWEGVSSDVIIFNWNSGSNQVESTQFFADRGHEQVIAGYYDFGNYYTLDWLESVNGMPGIKGVMYTTWIDDFSKMEDWSTEVWGGCSFETSTEDLSSPSITLSPNPANDYCEIILPNDQDILDVFVFNTLGILVAQTKETSLPIADLPAGVYQVFVKVEDKMLTSKLVLVE